MRAAVSAILLLATAVTAGTMRLDALDASRSWRLAGLDFDGNAAVSGDDLRAAIATRPRSWFYPWRPLPVLDPVAFAEDLDRLRALYRRRGYYDVTVDADLDADDAAGTVVVHVTIDEGEPVLTDAVAVTITGAHLPDERDVLAGLPLRRGAVFTQTDYDGARNALRSAYRAAGYARVTVEKSARVDPAERRAEAAFAVASGPPCTFGAVHVDGVARVEPEVVRREVAFAPGQPFREAAITRTRTDLIALQLFRTVQIAEEPGTGPVVDVHVVVTELPPRDVRVGIGYDTDEGVRGIAGWRHYDFLGGARQLGFTARASLIEQSIAADFVQPHWPTPRTRARLLFLGQTEEEDTYDLSRTRVGPRLEWTPSPTLTAYAFYRFEYDDLSNVPAAVERALPGGAPASSLLSGLAFGVDWTRADDPIDPTRGIVASGSVEPVGLGGDIHFVRVIGEGRLYHPLGLGFLGAGRLRLGVANPIAGDEEVPLFERFYAGGVNSVRGYGRRRVGPLVDNDPIGGRSLVELSAELRRRIRGNFGAAVFVDAGQVGLSGESLPFDDLFPGAGVGLRYHSPVGPIRVDLAFPVDPPPGDQRWQIHVSVGQAF